MLVRPFGWVLHEYPALALTSSGLTTALYFGAPMFVVGCWAMATGIAMFWPELKPLLNKMDTRPVLKEYLRSA
jgi:hypothetical protein